MIKINSKKYFLEPQLTLQRQYEALRAHFVDGLSRKQAAEKFGYSLSYYQLLVWNFLSGELTFFQEKKPGPKERRTSDIIRNKIIFWRKKNCSSPEIREKLSNENILIGTRTIERILQDEGFAKLFRRTLKERGLTIKKTIIPKKCKQLDFSTLTDARFDCQVAGIYYFIPYIINMGLENLVRKSSFPETSQLTKLNSLFSILVLKLIGIERLSHIMNLNFDYGFGLFAGLNVLPKPTTISTYSYRIDKQSTSTFMHNFVSTINKLDTDYYDGKTINLDFHAIPHFGDKSILEKNWIGTRNKSMKSALTFFAQDGESNMISYANADIKRADAPMEILNFVDYWFNVKGVMKQTLVFDSKLTTYDVLSQLDDDGVKFLTLRRRGENLIEEYLTKPRDEWTKVKLNIPKRKYNKFLAYEHNIVFPRQKLRVKEIVVREHGREKPTFIITNNFGLTLIDSVTLYAKRWRIENKLSELVDFFSLNALSSPVIIRIHFDVLMTMVASTLYMLLANDLKGFENCKSWDIFSKFINTHGRIIVEKNSVIVKIKKKAHTPILKSNELFCEKWEVPWWDNKILEYKWVS